MNLSGKAARYWIDKEKISLENTLVIVDDIALPLSKIRVRPGGSDAGHNGLRSLQESLGTTEYPKLRNGKIVALVIIVPMLFISEVFSSK